MKSWMDLPLTTPCTTYTVDTNECLEKALVAYTVKLIVVCCSREVEKASRKMLFHVSSFAKSPLGQMMWKVCGVEFG